MPLLHPPTDEMALHYFVSVFGHALNHAIVSLTLAVWNRHGHMTQQNLICAIVHEDIWLQVSPQTKTMVTTQIKSETQDGVRESHQNDQESRMETYIKKKKIRNRKREVVLPKWHNATTGVRFILLLLWRYFKRYCSPRE